MRAFIIRVVTAALTGTVLLAASPVAEAQYFGRNKVEYRQYDVDVLATQHFDIYYDENEREMAETVGRLAERWHTRLSRLLDHSLRGRQPLVIYRSAAEFQQTNVISGPIGEGTGGVTEGLKRRVVLPVTATLADTDHVLGHELVHAFQYDMARPEGGQGGPSLDRVPLWFVEGLAEYLSIGPIDAHTAMWVRDALRHDALPEVRKLSDPRYFPYRWGQAWWAYVGGRWGDEMIGRLFRVALRDGVEGAVTALLGVDEKTLTADWHAAIRAQYRAVLESTRRPGAYGRLLSRETGDERPLYASPVLSPDGQRIVYFSERDLLSVDLYLAEVETGRVVRKLTDTALDPHLGSLQFISSAGSWHPNGREFALGAVRRGRPVLVVLDVERGDRIRERAFPEMSEILNPAWSPDGRRIAFSATTAGRSDLYVYDLAEDRLLRLTSDAFADLQPAWSRDGRQIAFVTDRFTTSLAALDAGRYGLALVDVEGGRVERLDTFEQGKSINPQWAGDGRTLYFVSDRLGIANVYGLDVASSTIRQITNLDTGVSGITALSPALSVAAGAPRLAFSVHDDRKPVIVIADDPAVLAGSLPEDGWTASAAALPPAQRVSTSVATAIGDARTGLTAGGGQVSDYRPRLMLDRVGQPYVSAGYSRYGPTFGGGVAFLWSDMLGDHNLAAVVDANTYGGSFSNIWKDTGGLVAYQNLSGRWQWGVSAEQSPYLAGGVLTGAGVVDGEPVYVEQEILERQIFRAVSGGVSRPFSPATRVEFGASFQQIGFEREVRTLVASALTGELLSDDEETLSPFGGLSLGSASAALVHDNTIFGATSPVAGARSRFEVSPTFGTISFVNALADYRHYLMPARFYTVAARVLHYGRYGSGGEDERMVPLSIGYPQLVRGYGLGSISADECTPTADGTCPEFDRLLGSRMLVGNLELRFPLLRPFGVSGGMYGPIPTEIALFVDGGTAWTRDDRPTFFGGDRQAVASAGISFRVNLLGFAVAQIDLARPFHRPGRPWTWAFSLSPGF